MNHENSVREKVFDVKMQFANVIFLKDVPSLYMNGGHIISKYDLYNR